LLLRKLGWKAGQGIGPHNRRVVGDEDDDEMDIDNPVGLHRLAPKNTSLYEFKGKIDVFGLGFNALKDAPEFSGTCKVRF